MRAILLTILLTVITTSVFGYTRWVYIDQELKNASLIKEIVIVDYSSKYDTSKYQDQETVRKFISEMTYHFIGEPDSTYKYSPPLTGVLFSNPYYDISTKDSSYNRRVSEGYWPAIGDTVLVVFNKTNAITLFAEVIGAKHKKYKFWSPYHTSSWNTFFYANEPFQAYIPSEAEPYYSYNLKIQEAIKRDAERQGYEFSSQYHCLIAKNELWDYLENLRKE